MKLAKYIPYFLKYLITVFLLFALIASIGRTILLYKHGHAIPEDGLYWIFQIYLYGFLFDSTISSYLISIPFLILSVIYLAGISTEKAIWFLQYVFYALFLVVTVLVVADLPFFEFYNSRLSIGILSWTDSPGLMIKSVFGEDDYYPYIILALFVVPSLIWLLLRLRSNLNPQTVEYSWKARILVFVISAFFLFLGVRGNWKLNDKPITTESAIISNYTIVNQLSLNPIFNFFDSFRSVNLEDLPDEKAIEIAAQNIYSTGAECSPIARVVETSASPIKPNIVLILIESLSSHKMSAMKAKENLTPTLDSLSQNGLFFTNFYSNGVHTYNGLYSTIYGIPTVFHNKPMTDSYSSRVSLSGFSRNT